MLRSLLWSLLPELRRRAAEVPLCHMLREGWSAWKHGTKPGKEQSPDAEGGGKVMLKLQITRFLLHTPGTLFPVHICMMWSTVYWVCNKRCWGKVSRLPLEAVGSIPYI